MKIVVLGTRGFPGVQGGIETHCQHLYPKLRARGCKVIVLGRKPYIGPKPISYRGVWNLPLAAPRSKYTEALFHTARGIMIAGRIGPDVLHLHGIGPSLLAPLAKSLNMRVVVTHHGPDYRRTKWGILAKCTLRLGELAALRSADQVISISKTIAREIRHKYGRQSHIVPNGVVIPRLLTTTRTIERYGLTPERYVLAVGRFVPEKGFSDLITAFEKTSVPGWKLAIVGDGDHRTRYSRRLKDQANSCRRVVLTGILHGRDLGEMFSHAGLFVLPSTHEGLPIALLEALSYGLSVVVSDIAPHLEMDIPADRYFPVGNHHKLIEMLEFWMRAGPLREPQRRQQVNRIRREYNWDSIADQVLRVYRLACAGRVGREI